MLNFLKKKNSIKPDPENNIKPDTENNFNHEEVFDKDNAVFEYNNSNEIKSTKISELQIDNSNKEVSSSSLTEDNSKSGNDYKTNTIYKKNDTIRGNIDEFYKIKDEKDPSIDDLKKIIETIKEDFNKIKQDKKKNDDEEKKKKGGNKKKTGGIKGDITDEDIKNFEALLNEMEKIIKEIQIEKIFKEIKEKIIREYPNADEEFIRKALENGLSILNAPSSKGFLDAFYNSFKSDSSDESREQEELKNAIDNNLLEIYYFPSESKYFGKPGKVTKNNEYGDYGIIRTNPNTSFGTSIKTNIRKSEDFIAQLLQGLNGDPKRKPIFKKKIEIQDRSQIIEIAKRHMNEKRKDIDNIFQKLKPEPKKTGGKKKYTKKYTKKHKKTRKHKGGSKESKEFLKQIYDDFASIPNKEKIIEKYDKITESNYADLRKLYEFRTDIENYLKQNNYDMVLENKPYSLYQNDELIQKLDREIT